MKKRNITLCAVAMLCMQGYAEADTFILKKVTTLCGELCSDDCCLQEQSSKNEETPFHLKSGGS